MSSIYILKCDKNKFYVGKSNNVNKRIQEHFQTNGSAWTRKYKPLSVHKIIDTSDIFDEDKWTLKYMELYGIKNVRGGSFCKLILTKSELNIIRRMINGANDNCFLCGSDKHFIRSCPLRYNNNNNYYYLCFSTIFTCFKNFFLDI